MCSENQDDIPIRSVVTRSDRGWVAHCLDFNLEAVGGEPNEAVDLLEEAIDGHLERARRGEVKLFQRADEELWKLYHRAAEVKLLKEGPGHGHVEHRPVFSG
jgi:predicted RNase H-like HicB family nuclease